MTMMQLVWRLVLLQAWRLTLQLMKTQLVWSLTVLLAMMQLSRLLTLQLMTMQSQ
jgi:hypothetical protein